MRRNSTKSEKVKSDFKVVKKCTECQKEIPVACKVCPLCKCFITPAKPVKTPKEDEKEVDAKIRRTERIRRERPDFFNAMEVNNQFKKKKRKRKESCGSVASGTSITAATKTSTSSLRESIEEGDLPKKRRGRPRSTTSASVTSISSVIDQSDKGSETKSPTPEEDWYGHLPEEKFMQYKIILAEINRKFSTQNFKPV